VKAQWGIEAGSRDESSARKNLNEGAAKDSQGVVRRADLERIALGASCPFRQPALSP
jgi:hypothetical protein